MESSSLTRDQTWAHYFGSVSQEGSSEVISYIQDDKCLGEKAEWGLPGAGVVGSYSLIGIEIESYKMKKFWRWVAQQCECP